MSENIFFDTKKLKYRGTNVLIGKCARIRYPELVELHDNTIIDDFTFISTGLIMYEHSFIENNCSIMGGAKHKLTMGVNSVVTNNCSVMTSRLDFRNGLYFNHDPDGLVTAKMADVTVGDHVIVGSHSVVYPGVTVGEGVRTGEFTRINVDLDAWGLYVGIPVRRLGDVNKTEIMRQYDKFRIS